MCCKTSRHTDTYNTRTTDIYQYTHNYTDSITIYDSMNVRYTDSLKIVYHYIDRQKTNTKTDSVIINDTITIYRELSTDSTQNIKNNNKKSTSNKILAICISMLLFCIIIYKIHKS